MADSNDPTSGMEVFKIGRTRIIFPTDLTEDEFQFMSMIIYSYIQTVKYKTTHPNIWKIVDRLEDKKRKDNDAGVT